MKFFFKAFSIFLIVASPNTFAQGFFGDAIKNQIEGVKKQISDPAKSASSPIEKPPESASKQKNIVSADEKSSSSPTGQIDGEIDIKGIKIGMSVSEVQKLIQLPIDDFKESERCESMVLKTDQPQFLVGDFVISCKNSFKFGGTRVEVANFFFANKRLHLLFLSNGGGSGFAEQREAGEDTYPNIARLLIESKLKVKPKSETTKRVSGTTGRNSGGTREEINLVWTDSKNTKLLIPYMVVYEYEGKTAPAVSGGRFQTQLDSLSLNGADIEKYKIEREALVKKAVQDKKTNESKRISNDL
jgi:hypothetical protein